MTEEEAKIHMDTVLAKQLVRTDKEVVEKIVRSGTEYSLIYSDGYVETIKIYRTSYND